MQNPDGGVLTKVGLTDFSMASPPSGHQGTRYYEEVCSSSTISAAGMFAHAALVFADVDGLASEADDLADRAINAWDWYQDNPIREDCDTLEIKAGDADLSIAEQGQAEVVAAVYLFALTGESRFNAVVSRGYGSLNPFLEQSFHMYRPHQGDALLYYRELRRSTARVRAQIDSRIDELVDESLLYGTPEDDLYRSYLPNEAYHWGSNRVKANVGFSNLRIDPGPVANERAGGHLHYFHGVNPLGLTYLTNMGALGGDFSVQRMHHYWFGKHSIFHVDNSSLTGIPPGYIVGGANGVYSGSASPPSGQPVQKSYRDFSDAGEPTWEVTEPAIYYQASYIRLLTEVMAANMTETA